MKATMRSAVCKAANEMIRKSGNKSRAFRSNAFKCAWHNVKLAMAKQTKAEVKATELKAGDRICIEYGEAGNVVICTVEEKRAWFMGKFEVIAKTDCGMKVDFIADPAESIKKVA